MRKFIALMLTTLALCASARGQVGTFSGIVTQVQGQAQYWVFPSEAVSGNVNIWNTPIGWEGAGNLHISNSNNSWDWTMASDFNTSMNSTTFQLNVPWNSSDPYDWVSGPTLNTVNEDEYFSYDISGNLTTNLDGSLGGTGTGALQWGTGTTFGYDLWEIDFDITDIQFPASPVPEPASLSILALASPLILKLRR
jgi:hypothetical protein